MRIIPAYAKLNLGLSILGRRSDGFHDLSSLVVTIDWHDLVGLEVTPATFSRVHLELSGDSEQLTFIPGDSHNLAYKAAQRIAEMSPTSLELRIWIHKRIPVASGLGGASTDAAAVLKLGVDYLSQLDLPIAPLKLQEIAAELGSDVPALLFGGVSLMEGRGEFITPLPTKKRFWATVIMLAPSSTAAVYAELKVSEYESSNIAARIERSKTALLQSDLPSQADLGSGLEPPALRINYELADKLAHLRARTELDWHLTGSGGAAFNLSSSWAEAQNKVELAHQYGFAARSCQVLTSAVAQHE